MRKCWNCGKGVPVGAKRCIYCHAPVKPPKKDGDGDEPEAARPAVNSAASHTLLGIPGARGELGGGGALSSDGDESSSGGNTMFGIGPRGTGRGPTASGPLGGRRPTGKGVRQTLMGLGSVRVLSEPDDDDESPGRGAPGGGGNVRATMTGMPGVVARRPGADASASESSGTSPRPRADGGGRHTMMGMPAVKERGPAAPVLSAGNYLLRGGAEDEATVAVTPNEVRRAKELALTSMGKPGAATPTAPPAAPARPTPQKVPTAVVPAAAAAPAGGEEEEFDPLAGFEGAAQGKISSLMDEEVENLSSAVFGNDFAFGDDDLDFDDEDDDGLDFAAPPARSSAAASSSAGLGRGDVPEDEVEHDTAAAAAALGDMMADLEDVMPTEDEAAASLGLDESRTSGEALGGGHGGGGGFTLTESDLDDDEDDVDEDRTVADADVSNLMAKLSTADEKVISSESAAIRSSGDARVVSEPSLPKSRIEPKDEAPPAPSTSSPTPLAGASDASDGGVGLGAGGLLGVLGGLAAVAWMFVPVNGVMTALEFSSLDTATMMLVIVSGVGGLLAIVGSLMRLPAASKGLVLALLGIGIGLLAWTAVLAAPASFVAYGAAGLMLLGGLLYFAIKPKKS